MSVVGRTANGGRCEMASKSYVDEATDILQTVKGPETVKEVQVAAERGDSVDATFDRALARTGNH